MKRNLLYGSSLLLAETLALAATGGQDVSPADRERALQYLADSRRTLLETVKGLSERQWVFKAGADRWSAAEVVEHIALTEELTINAILPKLATAPAPPPDRDWQKVDALILAKVPDRTTKYQAPPPIVPTGRWSHADALQRFLEGSDQLAAILKSTPDLRRHIVDHPALGPLDGYQWILAVAAHTDRHTKQILEVMADPNFPKN